MKIYISGKITGLELAEAEKKFADAETNIHLHVPKLVQNHIPVNPMKINEFHPDKTWEDYMLADIKELFSCDAILMLSCWKDSKGARVEHAIAKEIGLRIFYAI